MTAGQLTMWLVDTSEPHKYAAHEHNERY